MKHIYKSLPYISTPSLKLFLYFLYISHLNLYSQYQSMCFYVKRTVHITQNHYCMHLLPKINVMIKFRTQRPLLDSYTIALGFHKFPEQYIYSKIQNNNQIKRRIQ